MRVAILPARGGSKRIPLKNIREFHGQPIMGYPIETAKRSGLFDAVYVSTDDLRIGGVAMEYGATVIPRPPSLAGDRVGTPEVMKHALEWLAEWGVLPAYACCIYPTAALMTVTDLHDGLDALDSNTGDALFSFGMGTEPPKDAGAWYWGVAAAWLNLEPLVAAHTVMVPVPEHRCCDINFVSDFVRAERMYAELHLAAA